MSKARWKTRLTLPQALAQGRFFVFSFLLFRFDVIAMSPRAEEVRKTAAAIRALHRHTLEATADVASRDDIRRLVERDAQGVRTRYPGEFRGNKQAISPAWN